MKHYGKLTAAAAAGFMALNVLNVVPVFADGQDTEQSNPIVVNPIDGKYKIKTSLELKDGTKPADGVTFNYQVTPKTDGLVDASNEVEAGTLFKGIEDSVKVTNYSKTEDKTEYSAELSVDLTKFEIPGIYVYTLSEQAHTANDPLYEGISKDGDESYTLNILIVKDGENLKIEGISASKGDSSKAADLSFEAEYDPGDELKIKKVTTGNQDTANADGPVFAFTLSIEGQKGETYYWQVLNASGVAVDGNGNSGTLTAGEDNKVSQTSIGLRKDWTVKVTGLSDSDKFKLTETEKHGYTADTNLNDKEMTFSTSSKDLTFTNTKTGNVPTGILMSAAPFAGLIGLGGVFAGLFFRRKRED